MAIPVQVRFHNTQPSSEIEEAVRERVARLERFADRLTGCRVTVEEPHRRHHSGNLYRVRVDLRYPGGEVVVSRDPDQDHAHEDVHVAIRDAFKAARRQLQDRVRVRRGQVKSHEAPPTVPTD